MSDQSVFTVAVVEDSEHPVVTMTGELDMSRVDQAWSIIEPLVNPPRSGLVIDMAGVTFVDSRGLNTLVRTLRHLNGAPLTVRAASERISRVLEVSGLAEMLVLK